MAKLTRRQMAEQLENRFNDYIESRVREQESIMHFYPHLTSVARARLEEAGAKLEHILKLTDTSM